MNIIALNYLKNPVQKVLVTILFIAIVFAIDLYVFQGFKVVVKKWVPTHSGLAHVLYWAIPREGRYGANRASNLQNLF